MTLTLEVTGAQAGSLGSASRKVFSEAGGTIGRLPTNHWVLSHQFVSSRHALIRCENGVFTIEDMRSANGLFINAQDNRLSPGQRYALKDGDTIFIDPFEIRVSVATESRRPALPVPSDPFATGDSFAAPPPAAPASSFVPSGQTGELDPLNLLGLEEPPAPPPAPRASDLRAGSALNDFFRPPAATAPPAPANPGNLIPDDYNPLLSDEPASVPAPTAPPRPARPTPRPTRPIAATPPAPSDVEARPVRPRPTSSGLRRPAGLTQGGPPPTDASVARHEPAASRQSSSASVAPAPPSAPSKAPAPAADPDLAALLAGAGLDPSAVTPELTQAFGKILRVVVSGLMDVLQARQRIKDEFGMRMTTFRPADNNPLKFSANVDDALHNLLVKRNAAYLGPVEAFEDAFADLRNHQMAMLAGMRVAYESMLAEFDPDRLQEQFDRQSKKGSLLSVPAKMRYWDLYREKFGDMVRDAEASFAELFGDEFARAYEEQLDRLKAQGRSDKR